MLQHNYGTEKINRLHTEAQSVRLTKEVKIPVWRKTLASHLNNIADLLDGFDILDTELDVSLDRKATA